ncbi:MAG: adenylate/guanylate cyclase domain-containing protein [Microthrixaceae bacterium]
MTVSPASTAEDGDDASVGIADAAPAPLSDVGRRAAREAAGLRWSIRIRVAVANLVGGFIVWVYLTWLFPWTDSGGPRNESLNLRVFLVYLASVAIVSVPVQNVLLHLAVRWAEAGEAPVRWHRGLVLRLAMSLSALSFLWWALAGVIFALVNGSPRVGVGIALAGLVTSTLIYLLLERQLRPLIDLAQGGEVNTRRQRDVERRLWVFWLLGSAVPLLGVGLAFLTSPEEAQISPLRLGILLSTGLVSGGVVMWGASSAVGRRIERVRRAMARVREGELDVRVPVDDGGDLGRLAEGFNSMTAGLAERAVLHDLFGRQVGQDVAQWALSHSPDLGGELRQVSVLFVDLDGYTAYSESHSPGEVVDMLNDFFGVVATVVDAHGGSINKFEGDAALCIFGAPLAQPDHAARALAAAAHLPEALAATEAGHHAGVGVATGEALAGYVGTPERYEFTVIGDVVNVAARLCELAKATPSGVLATAQTAEGAVATGGAVEVGTGAAVTLRATTGQGAARFENRGPARIRGRSQATELFELQDGPARPGRTPRRLSRPRVLRARSSRAPRPQEPEH